MTTKSAVRERGGEGSLYETDFQAWAFEQARLLRQGRFDEIDVGHVAEELEDMGRSEGRALRSELTELLAHLLKLRYSPSRYPRRHWEEEVANHRVRIENLLSESPSLKARLDNRFAATWKTARKLALLSLKRDGISDLPNENPFTLEQALDFDFWP